MIRFNDIITVSLNPCWDMTCRAENISWGSHQQLDSSEVVPAGKPLNVSRALHWMGIKSIAAGLWGQKDYRQMLEQTKDLKSKVRFAVMAVPGQTRQNVTIIDTANNREMHLRAPGELMNRRNLKVLRGELKKIIKAGSLCVFGGNLSGNDYLEDIIDLMNFCQNRGGLLAVDTSGPILKAMVKTVKPWLIKPNLSELSELTGQKYEGQTDELIEACRKLLDNVAIILLSRGEKGALLVTESDIIHCRCCGRPEPVHTTVGCGDFLLAGFIGSLQKKNDFQTALQTGVTAATARAWGWTGWAWAKAARKIKVE